MTQRAARDKREDRRQAQLEAAREARRQEDGRLALSHDYVRRFLQAFMVGSYLFEPIPVGNAQATAAMLGARDAALSMREFIKSIDPDLLFVMEREYDAQPRNMDVEPLGGAETDDGEDLLG